MRFLLSFLCLCVLIGCADSEKNLIPSSADGMETSDSEAPNRTLPKGFKKYWFNGEAELTSFTLSQERYGEIRNGHAVQIFVTEDFLPEAQVKANQASEETVSVLKLNNTKKFVTGIYPYSIMTSSFAPIERERHPLKVSTSVQEWCGQVYMQLNNQDAYEIVSHSYFEGEADQSMTLEKTWLEDEIWSRIRMNPEELPTGDLAVIPSFEALRMRHKDIKAYEAYANIKQGDSMSTYSLDFPMLERQLTIWFQSAFPHHIEKWEETNGTSPSDTLRLKTTATKLKRIRLPYWRHNTVSDTIWRDSLGIK